MLLRSLLARAATTLCAIALLAFPARAADPVFPPASHIGLVAPGAMKPSPSFPGFLDPATGASILILELPAPTYAKVESEMSSEALKRQNMTEEKRETVALKSGNGLLIVGDQVAGDKKLRKWIMLASGSDVSVLIAVQIPDTAKATYPDADVRAALMSMAVRTSVPINELLGLLPIRFDDLAGLRPFRVLANGSVFLTDGDKDTLDATAQPIFIISIARGGPEDADNRRNFARSLFTGLAEFKDVSILSTDMLLLDNTQTHEIQAEAKDAKTGIPMKLVQWVRFGNGAFIRFVGAARADVWLQEFAKFRAVRDGLKPKG